MTPEPQNEPQPKPLYPWPNEVSIAINLTEKIQKSVVEETGEKLSHPESVLQLDEIYRLAPDLEHGVRNAMNDREKRDHEYQFLDEQESEYAEFVLEELPAEQVNRLKEEIRSRTVGEEAINSA